MSTNPTAATAFNPAAPAAERFDAMSDLQKASTDLSGLLPRAEVQPVIDYILADMEDQQLAKARNGGQVVPFPSKTAGRKGIQSVVLDDLQISIMGDYIDRPGVIDFRALRSMVDQTPVLSAVVLTRVRQAQAFCKVQESGFGPGFVVRHANVSHQLSADEKMTVELLQRFILNNGWEFNPRARKRLGRQSLRQFMAMSVRDSLTMDSAPIETEFKRNRALGLDGFYAVDGSTIRLCSEDGYKGDDEIFALQVVNGQIRTAYDYSSLVYEPRNPRADVLTAGYGLSETELLIKVVTGFLNAMTLNIRGFSDNSIPKGVLHLSGNYSQEDLASFKRFWNGMVKGVNNAWAVPVLVSKDQESKASFENFGVEFNEMMFSKWMTFLTSIICAVYGMSPAEINFDSFSGGNTSPLGGSDTAEKLASSKDSGLNPLMSYYESIFSDYILAEFGDKFVFRWTGLNADDADKRHELKKATMTVNEIRAELGLPAQAAQWGEAPLNPSLIGPWTQEMQAQQQPGPDMQGDEQAPGFGQDQQGDPGAQGGEQSGGQADSGAPGADPGGSSGDGQGAPQGAPQGVAPAKGDADDDKPLKKANDGHDPLTGRFTARTDQVRFEKRSLADLYDFTLKYPLAAPDSAFARLGEGSLKVQLDHGPAVEASDGSIKVTGGKSPGKGYGMVKIIWRHGERSGKESGLRVTRGDVLALPEVVRSTPSSVAVDAEGQAVRWEWQRVRHDGMQVVYAASRFAARDNMNHVVSIHVDSQMGKAGMYAKGDLFGLTPWLPTDSLLTPLSAPGNLSVDHPGVGPLTVHYAESSLPVNVDADPLAKATASGVGIHDHVFFKHPKDGSATSGRVLAYGKDGFTAEHTSGHVGVPWDAYLGHKERAERTLTTVDKGEGGQLVRDELTGRTHFLASDGAEDDPEDQELNDERSLILGDNARKDSK